MEYRVMRTEGYFCGRQNSSFIGCSNSPRDRIRTPHLQEDFGRSQPKIKIDGIQSIRLIIKVSGSLWMKMAPPIVSRLDKVTAIQEEEIRTTTDNRRMVEMSYVLDESSKCNLRTSDLFEFQRMERSGNQLHFYFIQKFARELKYEAKSLWKDIAPYMAGMEQHIL